MMLDPVALARVLGLEAEAFRDPSARLGALWNRAALEEWVLPAANPGDTYRAILELDPTDPSALEATFRRELADARRGEPRARSHAISAVRALISFASGDARLALELRLGLMLESAAADTPDPDFAERLLSEALDRYAGALEIDPGSLTAATGLARLASQRGEAAGALAASESLSRLADDPRMRARYLLDGAEILLGAADLRGEAGQPERRARAVSMLDSRRRPPRDGFARRWPSRTTRHRVSGCLEPGQSRRRARDVWLGDRARRTRRAARPTRRNRRTS